MQGWKFYNFGVHMALEQLKTALILSSDFETNCRVYCTCLFVSFYFVQFPVEKNIPMSLSHILKIKLLMG